MEGGNASRAVIERLRSHAGNVPELVIGGIAHSACFGGEIYAGYTLAYLP